MLPFTVLIMTLVGIYLYWYRKKLRHERAKLAAVGREMKIAFEWLLMTTAPDLYHRPTRVFTYLERFPGDWFWRGRRRLVFSVRISSEEDDSIVREMVKQFFSEYLGRSGHRDYPFWVRFSKVRKKSQRNIAMVERRSS
jgi:hypothetical protein